MGQYAPGTQSFEAGVSRRDSRVFQRRQNVADILAGFGQLAQTLGQVRRAHEAEANDALYTQKLGELMRGGGAPQQPPAITAQNVPAMAEDVPQGWQGYQPPTPAPRDPGASYDAGVMQAAQPSASSFLERMGRTFTPWTNGGYQPRLSGQQAASLIQMRQGMAGQAAAAARENRKLAMEEAAQKSKSALEDAQRGYYERRGDGSSGKEQNFNNEVGWYNHYVDKQGAVDALKVAIGKRPLTTESVARFKALAEKEPDEFISSVYRQLGEAGLTPEAEKAAREQAISSLDAISKIYGDQANRWKPAADAQERLSGGRAAGVLGTAPPPPAGKTSTASAPDTNDPYSRSDDAEYEAKWMASHGKTPATMTEEDASQMLDDYMREHPGG